MKSSLFVRGFTLIEMIIVLAIIGLIIAIGVPAYQNYNRGRMLDQAKERLKQDLLLARSRAQSGEKVSGCSTDRLEGYYIQFTGNSYTIFGRCGVLDFSSTTVNLSTYGNITLDTTPAVIDFRFKPLNLGVDGLETYSQLIIRLQNPTTGLFRLIIIDRSGDIQ